MASGIREGKVLMVPLLSSTSNRNPNTNPRLRVRKRPPDPLLSVCKCLSYFTCFSAILCIIVNAVSAYRSLNHPSDIFDAIFRGYAIFIGCFVILAQIEWNFIFRFYKFLEYWAGRGMLQIFVAVMTRAFPDYSGERRELVLAQIIACYMLLTCGVVYVVSGILCIGFLNRSLQKREISREQAAKDLEELERRRQELEQRLMEE